MNRRSLLITALFAPSAMFVSSAEAKKIPDWNKGAEEIEEAKFEKAFQKLKNNPAFRDAVFAGDIPVLLSMFNHATNTDYNVDFTFKGKGRENITFAIRCHKVKGQWQFSITLGRR